MSANTKLWMPQLRHMPVSFIPLFRQVPQNHLLFILRLASQSELSLPIHVGSCSFPFPVAKKSLSWENHGKNTLWIWITTRYFTHLKCWAGGSYPLLWPRGSRGLVTGHPPRVRPWAPPRPYPLPPVGGCCWGHKSCWPQKMQMKWDEMKWIIWIINKELGLVSNYEERVSASKIGTSPTKNVFFGTGDLTNKQASPRSKTWRVSLQAWKTWIYRKTPSPTGWYWYHMDGFNSLDPSHGLSSHGGYPRPDAALLSLGEVIREPMMVMVTRAFDL
jgi:hypothetical protein